MLSKGYKVILSCTQNTGFVVDMEAISLLAGDSLKSITHEYIHFLIVSLRVFGCMGSFFVCRW